MSDDDPKQWDIVASYAPGTCDSPGMLAERFSVADDLVEQRLGERCVETCAECGWWFNEAMDGAAESSNDPLCSDCR